MATNSVLGYDLSDAKDPTDSIPDQAHSQPPVSVRSSGVLSSQMLSHASQAICLGPATAYQLNAIRLDGDTDVLDALSVLHRSDRQWRDMGRWRCQDLMKREGLGNNHSADLDHADDSRAG